MSSVQEIEEKIAYIQARLQELRAEKANKTKIKSWTVILEHYESKLKLKKQSSGWRSQAQAGERYIKFHRIAPTKDLIGLENGLYKPNLCRLFP